MIRTALENGSAFYRARSDGSPYSVTGFGLGADGLGLAIVNSITKAHDGTLTLTPRAGGGLYLTVQLPAARSS